MAKVDERLSRLADKLIDGVIDDALYETKKTALIVERKRYTQLVDKAGDVQARIGKLDQFLELAKSLCLHYRLATDGQKRELVNFAFSNRTAQGKNLLLEPSNWLLTLQMVVPDLVGAPHSDSSRTFEAISDCLDNAEMDGLALVDNDMIERLQKTSGVTRPSCWSANRSLGGA